MTTYAVTPTLFVGVDSPDHVDPIYNLIGKWSTKSDDDVVALAVGIITGFDPKGSVRPAVVVPTLKVAKRVLHGLGMSPEAIEDRIQFATRNRFSA